MAIKGLGDARRVVNDEWRQLAELPAAGLSGGVPALAGCVRLGEVLGRVRDDPDAVLAAVIGAAQRGDLQAGRIVVQAMLPKLVRMCSRDADNDLQTYLACLWETVVTYPLERRPARVAANLALDTLKRAKRASDGRCETACARRGRRRLAGRPRVLRAARLGPWRRRHGCRCGLTSRLAADVLDAREVPEGGVSAAAGGARLLFCAAPTRHLRNPSRTWPLDWNRRTTPHGADSPCCAPPGSWATRKNRTCVSQFPLTGTQGAPGAGDRRDRGGAGTLAEQVGLDALASETLSVVYLDGLTSRQAAEVLGVSADVVRWRWHVRQLDAVLPLSFPPPRGLPLSRQLASPRTRPGAGRRARRVTVRRGGPAPGRAPDSAPPLI